MKFINFLDLKIVKTHQPDTLMDERSMYRPPNYRMFKDNDQPDDLPDDQLDEYDRFNQMKRFERFNSKKTHFFPVKNTNDDKRLKGSKTRLESFIEWGAKLLFELANDLRANISKGHRDLLDDVLDRLLNTFDKILTRINNNFYFYIDYNADDEPNEKRNKTVLHGSSTKNQIRVHPIIAKTREAVVQSSYQVLSKALDLIKYGFALLCENELVDSMSNRYNVKFFKDLICNTVAANG